MAQSLKGRGARSWLVTEPRGLLTAASSGRLGDRRTCILVVMLICGVCAHAQTTQHVNEDTLAVVGTTVITAREYAESYARKVLTIGLTDNGETRKQFLANLVEDEFLIAMARDEKLDRTPAARAALGRIRLQTLLERYVARHVDSHVVVTESDLRDLYLKLNTRIQVRHLFSPTRQGADSLLEALGAGRSFDELAMGAFTDPVLRLNGGLLGYITPDEMDPAFERAAFALKVGEISGPVRTARGYSIIRVDDIRCNPLLTETEFLRAKDKLQRFARSRKLREGFRQATDALRETLHVAFNRALMGRLFAMGERRFLLNMPQEPWDALSPADMRETIVTTSRGTWSTGELIEAFASLPERQRKWIHTEEDLEDVAAGLVMQREVARLALQEGLDRDSGYEDEVRREFDSYLLQTIEEKLKSQLTMSRDSLKAFYLQHQNSFMTPPEVRLSLILLDDPVAADSVVRMLQRGERFGDLARRFSLQRSTAEWGGDAGYFQRQPLGEFGDKLFDLALGAWTGPIAFEGRYLLAQCTDRRRGALRSFEEAVNDVRQAVVASSWLSARRRAVESFRKKITWSIRPEKLAYVSLPYPHR